MKNLKNYLEDVQKLIGYQFDNTNLLFQAFKRRSYSEENGGENNEVLEFVGDRVLDLYVTKIIIDKYGYIKANLENIEFAIPKSMNEGSLTNIKKSLVNKNMLSKQIDRLELKNYLIMGKGDILQGNQDGISVKEDLFEAILGAIAIDSAWDPVKLEKSVRLMLDIDNFFENYVVGDQNYVGLIQEWNQKKYGEVPNYEIALESNDCYKATLLLETRKGQKNYQAEGNSKLAARANVAKEAYIDLGNCGELSSNMDDIIQDITLETAINKLQELAQKGYISMPDYSQVMKYDDDNNQIWMCKCTIKSHSIEMSGTSSSKKTAKKIAAHECILNVIDTVII